VAATTAPAASGLAQCIVGRWNVPDVNAYYQSAFAQLLPAGTTPITNLTATGTMEYEFFADGRGSGQIDVTARATLAGAPIAVTVRGPAAGRYRVEGNQVILSGEAGMSNAVTVSATLAGATILPPQPIGAVFPIDPTSQARANATCNATTLSFQVVDPANAPSVSMTRR
jgi:hypothetical protein